MNRATTKDRMMDTVEKPSISLCMIVKNEGRFLRQCLESVKDCVDEVVIVDTGSTDKTADIAQSLGAKVYFHPWENDFSKHRNQSISYASGDWILILDGDEVLTPGSGRVIRDAVKEQGVDSLFVPVVCYFENRSRSSWHNSIRVFKNQADIRYEGIVHNQLAGYKTPRFCSGKIYNYGYDINQRNVQQKFERTSALLKKSIREDPENFRHYHDLTVSYASMGLFSQAIRSGKKAMALYHSQPLADLNILWTYFVVATSYLNINAVDDAETIARQALEIKRDNIDAYFILASIYATRRDRKAFEDAYKHFIDLQKQIKASPEILSGLVVNKIDEKWRLDLDYGLILLEERRLAEAADQFDLAVEEAPDRVIACRLAMAMCRDAGYVDFAEKYLAKATEAGLEKYQRDLDDASIKKALGDETGYTQRLNGLLSNVQQCPPDLCKDLGMEALKLGRPSKAQSLLSRAIDFGYCQPWIFSAIALTCKYQNKIKEAVQWNKRAIEMDDLYVDAYVNLGHLYYESQEWALAEKNYGRALAIGGAQRDVLFRLSVISLMKETPAETLRYCEDLLRSLNLTTDQIEPGVSGFAHIYRRIGEGFLQVNEKKLHAEAMNLVRLFDHEAAGAAGTA